MAPLRPGSGAAPGLALPSLAEASGEALDASSLAVLLQYSLAAQKEEEVALTKAKEAEEAKEKEVRKGQARGEDAGHQPSCPRRYRHAC